MEHKNVVLWNDELIRPWIGYRNEILKLTIRVLALRQINSPWRRVNVPSKRQLLNLFLVANWPYQLSWQIGEIFVSRQKSPANSYNFVTPATDNKRAKVRLTYLKLHVVLRNPFFSPKLSEIRSLMCLYFPSVFVNHKTYNSTWSTTKNCPRTGRCCRKALIKGICRTILLINNN